MGLFSRLVKKKAVREISKNQTPSESKAEKLVREIMNGAVVTLEGAKTQALRITVLVRFGPDAIPIIESVIQRVARYGDCIAVFENAGLLCEAIGKIGGQKASEVLSRLATQPSDIAEYRYIRAGAEKGLAGLGQHPSNAGIGMKTKETGESGKPLTRSAIPPLLDAAQEQAKAGECLAAVEFFLQAVEIEPEFMMSSLVWQHIASVFSEVQPPVWGKNWIRIPKELVPEEVMARLSKLPNQSRLPGYPGPYVEPPGEVEIVALIADLRSILKRFSDRESIPDPVQARVSTTPGGNDTRWKTEQAGGKAMRDSEMLSLLRKLCAAYVNNDPVYKKLEPIATEIGKQLDKRGGIAEMRRIFHQLGGIRGARTLEMHWGGIGEWLG